MSENSMPEKKAAIFFADGCEEIEGLTVVDILYRAGVPLQKISVSGSLTVVSSHRLSFLCDSLIADEDLEQYDLLILPGGIPGTLNLKACEPLRRAILSFDRQGKGLAAICAAPSVFGDLGLLKGRKCCCNPPWTDKVAESGAEVLTEETVRDGNIITSRAMGTSIPFALEILAWLRGEEAAEEMRRKIVYRCGGQG